MKIKSLLKYMSLCGRVGMPSGVCAVQDLLYHCTTYCTDLLSLKNSIDYVYLIDPANANNFNIIPTNQILLLRSSDDDKNSYTTTCKIHCFSSQKLSVLF